MPSSIISKEGNLDHVIFFAKTALCMYCFHHANENMTTIVPLFSKPENNGHPHENLT